MKSIAFNACYALAFESHGECDEPDCWIVRMLNDPMEETENCVIEWARTGAQCDRFNKIYERFLVLKH